jgi:uncharacterized protein YkwD
VKAKLTALLLAGVLAATMTTPAMGFSSYLWRHNLLHRINHYRLAHGLHRLTGGRRLARAARAHSANMAAHHMLSHYSSSGVDWLTRIRSYGYRGNWVGENLAVGMWTPRHTLRMWIRSPEHRANLLNRHYRVIGMGVTLGTWAGHRAYYITADFGGP